MKGNKYECYLKLFIAYQMSRNELLNLRWSDIDFESDTITIYPISHDKDESNYRWNFGRHSELGRQYPLLSSIKASLLKQDRGCEFVCVNRLGQRLNAATLSRNARYIARRARLPELLLNELNAGFNHLIKSIAPSPDFYLCWTRVDTLNRGNKRGQSVYDDFNLFGSKRFENALNKFLETRVVKEAVM